MAPRMKKSSSISRTSVLTSTANEPKSITNKGKRRPSSQITSLPEAPTTNEAHSIRESSARSRKSFKATHREIISERGEGVAQQTNKYIRNVMPIATSTP